MATRHVPTCHPAMSSCEFLNFIYTADQREYVIFEPLVRELQIQPLPHVQRGERKPFAPQGKFNEYVIDGYFHGFKKPVCPQSMILEFHLAATPASSPP